MKKGKHGIFMDLVSQWRETLCDTVFEYLTVYINWNHWRNASCDSILSSCDTTLPFVMFQLRHDFSVLFLADGKCIKPADPSNGAATCQSTPTTMQCSISCQSGFKFEYSPPSQYVCRDGTWSPQPSFPRCIPGKTFHLHLSTCKVTSQLYLSTC